MKLIDKIKDIIYPKFDKNAEVIANRYAFKCLSITILIVFFIWILNKVGIFIIDESVTDFTLISSTLLYLMGLVIFYNLDMSTPWTKYFLITWTVVIITCITSCLTYHAPIVGVVPILFTCMYSSKRIKWYTLFIMILSTIVTVYIGYYYGICDANMVLLTREPISRYINGNNTFALTEINNNVPLNLALFYVFPRSLLYIVLAVMCANVSKIITINTNYATEMRHLAERDQMTGAYTKSKYLSMIENDYIHEEHIGIIYWDINYLKKANDTLGHEYGDKLIFAVADSIRQFNNDNDKTYRLGGDEFVMVMRGATEKTVKEKINKWTAAIKNAEPIDDIPLSASYGYAWGEGKNIEQIIHDADQMMYENKRKHHGTR